MLLLSTLMWIWFTISLTLDQWYGFSDLKRESGVVKELQYEITKLVNKPLFKDTTCEVRIKLAGHRDVYSILAKCSNDIVASNVFVGDSIIIHTRGESKWGILSLTKTSRILNLSKGNLTLVDYRNIKRSQENMNIFTGVAAIVFLILYIIKLRKRLLFADE